MKVWLTTTSYRAQEWLSRTEPLLELARANIEQAPQRRYALASSPESAEVIVYVEAEYIKTPAWLELFYSEDLVRRYPNKCFVVDSADTCWGVLPGVFTHLLASQVDPARTSSGGFLRMYNTLGEDVWRARGREEPKLLLSFRGSRSHPLRARVFDVIPPSARVAVTESRGWFDHADEVKRAYVEELHDSAFVLCPRGAAPATYRLFEALQLGRVPVILSDDWAAPPGVCWADFSIRLHESRLPDVLDVVARYEPLAREMGEMARRAWEEHFAPNVVYYRALQSIETMLALRPADHDERAYQDWRSFRAQWKLGWTMPQKVVKAIKNGDALERIKARALRREAR